MAQEISMAYSNVISENINNGVNINGENRKA